MSKSVTLNAPRKFAMTFDGRLLTRGFWLYVWRIDAPGRTLVYVGRTGDSSSPHAGSPFSRIGQHLDFRPYAKGNAMGKRLRAAGAEPNECAFRMIAVGPLFPEQASMEDHGPVRDRVAALEKALAGMLRVRGYEVLGIHHCATELDQELFATIESLVADEFPVVTSTPI
jgi:hypothetical protein